MTGLILAAAIGLSYLLSRWLLGGADRAAASGDRRLLTVCAIAAPGAVLGILLGGTVTMLLADCPLFSLADKILVGTLVPGFLAVVAVACVRQVRAAVRQRRLLHELSAPAGDLDLGAEVADLARHMGVRVPSLRVLPTGEPVACSVGPLQPAIVVSQGLLERLDSRERQAVFAHELAHLAHGDHLAGFLGAWFRDGLWFLPTAREAWRRFDASSELACDARSAACTGRPGAVASALVKLEPGHDAHPRLRQLLDAPIREGNPAIGYGVVAAGVMAIVLALAPIWYVPACMTFICKM